MILFHYLDDFLILAGCPRELEDVTRRVVRALRDAGFLVSPKSVLEPTTRILFLGKCIDTRERNILSHPRASLQMFAQRARLPKAAHPHCRHLNKVLGFIRWHVGPRRGMNPFLAVAYCCQRWGQEGQHIPLKYFVYAMEPWLTPDYLLFKRGAVLLICGCVFLRPYLLMRRSAFSVPGRGRLSRSGLMSFRLQA